LVPALEFENEEYTMADDTARNDLAYEALDLVEDARGFAELAQLFAARGWSAMSRHSLQKASGRLVRAAALLEMVDAAADDERAAVLAQTH
jgi:hypothetical protein